jgi:hypothetical protein
LPPELRDNYPCQLGDETDQRQQHAETSQRDDRLVLGRVSKVSWVA